MGPFDSQGRAIAPAKPLQRRERCKGHERTTIEGTHGSFSRRHPSRGRRRRRASIGKCSLSKGSTLPCERRPVTKGARWLSSRGSIRRRVAIPRLKDHRPARRTSIVARRFECERRLRKQAFRARLAFSLERTGNRSFEENPMSGGSSGIPFSLSSDDGLVAPRAARASEDHVFVGVVAHLEATVEIER